MPTVAKRKKTADMPDSPPKRVTRARAKTKDDVDERITTKKVAVTHENGVRVSSSAIAPAKAVKRKTRSDESAHATMAKAPKTRGRTIDRPQLQDNTTNVLEDTKPLTRTRQARSSKITLNKVEAPRTRRGRPKKEDGNSEITQNVDQEAQQELTNVKKPSRSRVSAKPRERADTKSVSKAAIPKKKVQFKDDLQTGKENVLLSEMLEEKSMGDPIGLRAKAVRKPVAGRSVTTRSTAATRKKAPPRNGADKPVVGGKPMPLSPKKVTQVAKSASVGSEDELSGGKTPIRALSRSPVKHPQSARKIIDDSPLKFDFRFMNIVSSPSKSVSASALTTPARRPPVSPFKDALKESPRRGVIAPQQMSAGKGHGTSPFKSSLQLSPKRSLLFSASKPTFSQPAVPHPSLLKSPARRPAGSPAKSIFALSPVKFVRKSVVCSTEYHGESDDRETPTEKAASSPLRAARSPNMRLQPYTFGLSDQNTEESSNSSCVVNLGAPNLFCDVTASNQSKTPSRAYDNGDVLGTDFETLAKSSPLGDEAAASLPNIEPRTTKDNDIEAQSTTPPGQPRQSIGPVLQDNVAAFREAEIGSDSEDELSSPIKDGFGSHLPSFGISSRDFAINPFIRRTSMSPAKASPGIMTPLADQLGCWTASSPPKLAFNHGSTQALAATNSLVLSELREDGVQVTLKGASPANNSHFEEQMLVRDDAEDDLSVPVVLGDTGDLELFKASMESTSSTEYGDENQVPLDPELLNEEPLLAPEQSTCTPAKVFETREIHTISKVPLRPADDSVSPLRSIRKRSKSISGLFPPSRIPQISAPKNDSPTGLADQLISLPKLVSSALEEAKNTITPAKQNPEAEEYDLLAHIASPIGSTRKPQSNVLKGVTAFVDVHTSEGADASGIFHDLLHQMGAKCVKQWSWNPRASIVHDGQSVTESTASAKPGITHVIYKDGGKRTLEKVRATKGAVECVGVGWVLE